MIDLIKFQNKLYFYDNVKKLAFLCISIFAFVYLIIGIILLINFMNVLNIIQTCLIGFFIINIINLILNLIVALFSHLMSVKIKYNMKKEGYNYD